MVLYKIVSPEQWFKSNQHDILTLDSNDKKFIHFSTEEQLPRIIKKYWANKKRVVLTIDPQKLPGKMVLEANRPGGDKYYHLYNGSIPHNAVVAITTACR